MTNDLAKIAVYTEKDKSKAEQVVEVLKGMGYEAKKGRFDIEYIDSQPYIYLRGKNIANGSSDGNVFMLYENPTILSFSDFMQQYGNQGKKPTTMSDNKLMEAIKHLLPLIYYSQIHTVTGVRPAEFDSHKDAWRKAQQFVWDNCEVKDGEYILKERSKPLEALKSTVYRHKINGWWAKKVPDEKYMSEMLNGIWFYPAQLIEESGDWEPVPEEKKFEFSRLSMKIFKDKKVIIDFRHEGLEYGKPICDFLNEREKK